MEDQVLISLIIFLLGLFIGIYLGKNLADFKWSYNSKIPSRVICYKSFYKVVEIDDPESWELLEPFKESI